MTSRRAALWITPLSVAGLWLAGWGALGTGGVSAGGSTTPSHAEHGTPVPKAPAERTGDQGERKTITGEVMDPACFLQAGPKSIGPGHFQCAVDCARSGQTLAVYDREHDRIYFIAGELPGKNPNEPLLPYIHKKVDVTGVVFHRSDAWGIVISRVALHKEKGIVSSDAAAPPVGNSASGGAKTGGR